MNRLEDKQAKAMGDDASRMKAAIREHVAYAKDMPLKKNL